MAKRKDRPGQLPDEDVHGRSAAVRTAWIIGAIALAFYIGALVQGHRGHLNTSWHPLPTSAAVTTTGAQPHAGAGQPAATSNKP